MNAFYSLFRTDTLSVRRHFYLSPPSSPLHWGHPHTTSAVCPLLRRCQLVGRTDIKRRSLNGPWRHNYRDRGRLWADQEEMILKSPQKGTQLSDSTETPIKRTLGNSLQGIHKQPTHVYRIPAPWKTSIKTALGKSQAPLSKKTQHCRSPVRISLILSREPHVIHFSQQSWGGRPSRHHLLVVDETNG